MATTLGILSYLVVAAFYDLQFRRVPNMLVIPGMISAFFISILYRGIDGIPVFFLHLFIVMTALFPLYTLGVIGAGDVKLLSVVSTILDGRTIIIFIITVFLTGGVFSLYYAIRAGDHAARAYRMKNHFISVIRTGKVIKYLPADPDTGYIPFAVCILIGFFVISIIRL